MKAKWTFDHLRDLRDLGTDHFNLPPPKTEEQEREDAIIKIAVQNFIIDVEDYLVDPIKNE